MRNLNWKAALMVGAALLLPAAQASAVSLSFVGNFTLTDDDTDGFSELLTFDNPFGPRSGVVSAFTPISDLIFGVDFATVEIADLTLLPLSPTFVFSPTIYVDGFAVYDNGGTLLFDGDLEVAALEIMDSTGDINPMFQMNVTNVTAGGGYTPLSSPIVEAFLAAGGTVNVTIQGGADLATLIESGQTVTSTYSGTAVPEPSTLLLMGSGLLGAAIFGGRRSR